MILSVALAILVIAGLLVPLPFHGQAASSLGDLVHAPLFAGVTLGVLFLLQYLRPIPPLGMSLARRSAVVAGLLFGFGLATECMQQLLGRSGTFHDAAADGLGIVAALSLYASWHFKRERRERVWIRGALLSFAIAAIAISWWRPVRTLLEVVSAPRDIPQLASLETADKLGRWCCWADTHCTDAQFSASPHESCHEFVD
jgi:hypothetical protein